jgi:hypothetical protein
MTSADVAFDPSGYRLLEPHDEFLPAALGATSFFDGYDRGIAWLSSGPEHLGGDARWMLWSAVQSVFELGLCYS